MTQNSIQEEIKSRLKSGNACHHSVQYLCLPVFHPKIYRDAGKSLARPTSRCILFDGENISFDASVIYINSTNIPPVMIIIRIYETQNSLL